MNIIIKAHNFEITPSIDQHVRNNFKRITNHFDHLIDAKFKPDISRFQNN